jgi:hypothetical protein
MRIRHCLPILLFAGLLLGASLPARAGLEVNPHLTPLLPFTGKTWLGELTSPSSDEPAYDVARWELALNGQAIRILHSVNEGEYGGETVIVWDEKRQSLVFFYFTTGGFYTEGTMSHADGVFESHEVVTGNKDGITEVKATGRLLPDGRMLSTSQYLQKGAWVDGHEIYYEETPEAEVVFRPVAGH